MPVPPQTVTANGNAQLSNTQVKIGSLSLALDGSGDYLQITDDDSIEPGSGDFTFEFWFYPTDSTNRQAICHWSNGSDYSFGLDYNYQPNGVARAIHIWASSDGSNWDLCHGDNAPNNSARHFAATSLTANAWNHVAIVRNGSSLASYINGTKDIDATNVSTTAIINKSAAKNFGIWFSSGALTNLSGYIDEMRWSNTARYTSTFTPSTTAFSNDANTKMLLHFEGSNGSTTITDSAGGSAYTLTAAYGSFTETGQATTFTKAMKLTAAYASFTLTGIASLFTVARTYTLTAAYTAFTLTGKAANLLLNGGTATWTNTSKNTSSWTNATQNSATWTPINKS